MTMKEGIKFKINYFSSFLLMSTVIDAAKSEISLYAKCALKCFILGALVLHINLKGYLYVIIAMEASSENAPNAFSSYKL